MHRTTTSYYRILEVDSGVSQESIEAAYRRLARRYHPDLNRNKDSKSKMQEINEAYQVLRDPQKRDSYDLHLRTLIKAEYNQTATNDSVIPKWPPANTPGQTTKPPPKPYKGQPDMFSGAAGTMPTTCEQCGRSDASLRYATFPYVISLILVSLRRGEHGLYCSKCRNRKMNSAKLVSFFFGWWGIPFGIFYTLGALFAPNDGVLDAKINADYLKRLGGYFIHHGRLVDAQRAIKSSLGFKYDPELAATASAIFGDTTLPINIRSPKSSYSTWVAVVIISAMAIAIGIAVTNVFRDPHQRIPAALISQQAFTMNKAQTPSTQPTGSVPEEWTHFKSRQGVVEVEYPAQWKVNTDANQEVELTGLLTGVILMWSTNETDKSIRDLIANSKNSPDFVDTYFSSLRKYLEGELSNKGGSIQRIDRPVIKQIGEYYTIYNEVITSYPSVSGVPGSIKRNHLIHYLFDCGTYVCRVNFYKEGADPFTAVQRQLAEQILTSIVIVPAISTPGAASIQSPQTIDSSASFSSLSFCYDNEFSAFAKQCGRNHELFTGIVKKLYVSWVSSRETQNVSILKRWYFNGEHFLDSTGSKGYTYLEETTRGSLRPGKYTMELYVSNRLMQRGSFTILE